jgi:hypothetical protein
MHRIQKITRLISLFVVLFTLFQACKTAVVVKEEEKQAVDRFSDDYYQNMNSNIERLYHLKSGLFVQYQENLADSSMQIWDFNDGEDSMILFVQPVGEVSKLGYWLYCRQFVSNMPESPVYEAYEHIEQISRDSFKGTYYALEEKVKWEDVQNQEVLTNVDFDQLEPNGELIFYYKKSNVKFHANSLPYENPRVDAKDYRQDFYSYTPAEIQFRSRYAKNPDVKVEDWRVSWQRDHMIRLRIELTPFTEVLK